MENKDILEDKKRISQNDFVPLVIFLAMSCICLFGLIAVTFWGLDDFKKTILTNATSTAFAVATQQENVTSTAVARATEQGVYEFIERFDEVSARWPVELQKNEYWEGSMNIKDGTYVWDIEKIKKTFIWWADFYKGDKIKDFDVYVDTKFVSGTLGDVCSGLIFRKSSEGWNNGGYTFSICNDSHFEVAYHGKDEWESIVGWVSSDSIQRTDWNRIEVSARGDNFTFIINNVFVFETTDDRQKEGGLAVFIELDKKNPAKVWFDNFGYQSR